MATTYSVVLSLNTTGSLDAKLDNVGRKADAAHGSLKSLRNAASTLGSTMSDVGGKLGEALESIADKAMSVASSITKIGLAAATGLAAYGVGHLNNELEQTQISLGAIAKAQGFAGTFEQGFEMAGTQLARMKQDVKTLPGDLGQLSNIMKMIATPAAQGGANLDTIRKLAGSTMLTSTILGVQSDVAAREMAGLLSGRAGAHNIFGARLGLIGEEAQRFNKLAPSERLARLNAEIGKYSAAADKFGTSFIAQFTTLKDNLKYSVLAEATGPLFERVKSAMASINAWFDHNKTVVDAFVKVVGQDLANAFDFVARKVSLIEPMIRKAVDALAHLSMKDVGHTASLAGISLFGVEGAAGLLRLMAGGSGHGKSAIDKLDSLVRKSALVAPEGATSFNAVSGRFVGEGGKFMAAGGLFELLANPAGLIAAGGAFVILGAAITAVVGAVHSLTDETSEFHAYAMSLWHSIESTVSDAFTRIKAAGEEMWQALSPLVDMMGTDLLFAIKQTVPVLEAVASGFTAAAHGLENMLAVLRQVPGVGQFIPGGGGSSTVFSREEHLAGISGRGTLKEAAEKFGEAVAKKGGGGGGGGTSIQKVEIVVNSNQDPSRIARIVFDEMNRVARNPKGSAHIPRYDMQHG